MTNANRARIAILLEKLSDPGYFLERQATSREIAELLIPEEPVGACERTGHSHYPGPCDCPCHKPKHEPAKAENPQEWLDGEDFANLLQAVWRSGKNGNAHFWFQIREAIRANYVSPRETRYREALEMIANARWDFPKQGPVSIAQDALKDSK